MLIAGNRLQVQFFHSFSCPGSLAQEFQTRFDAGVFSKAFDGNTLPQFLPAMFFHKRSEDHFEGDAMQGIVGFGWVHRMMGSLPVNLAMVKGCEFYAF